MAEYIERKELLQDVDETVIVSGKTGATNQELRGINKIIGRIQAMPTADVVEVVRCKDCRHYVANYCTRDIRGRTNMFYMSDNDFCNYGERRDIDNG